MAVHYGRQSPFRSAMKLVASEPAVCRYRTGRLRGSARARRLVASTVAQSPACQPQRSPRLFAEETTTPVLDPRGRENEDRQLWAMRTITDPAAVLNFHRRRAPSGIARETGFAIKRARSEAPQDGPVCHTLASSETTNAPVHRGGWAARPMMQADYRRGQNA